MGAGARTEDAGGVRWHPTRSWRGKRHAVSREVAGEGGQQELRKRAPTTVVAMSTAMDAPAPAAIVTANGGAITAAMARVGRLLLVRMTLGAVGEVLASAVAAIARAARTRVRAAALAVVTAGESEHHGALLSGALSLGFLDEEDAGEDGVEGALLIAEDDADSFEALVEAMEELGGESDLGDGVLDISDGIGEMFHALCILSD